MFHDVEESVASKQPQIHPNNMDNMVYIIGKRLFDTIAKDAIMCDISCSGLNPSKVGVSRSS